MPVSVMSDPVKASDDMAPPSRARHVLIVTPAFDSNSLGRTHVLWRLAMLNGWTARVISSEGDHVWPPLAGDPMERDCVRIPPGESGRAIAFAREADIVISVKPIEASYGHAVRWARAADRPLLADIDDPDLERLPLLRLLARQLLKPRKYWPDSRIRMTIGRYPHLVSNPVLQRRHGGVVIPHARSIADEIPEHRRAAPVVAFVGTNRRHKGLDEIRRAVAEMQDLGVTLTVTDERPADAEPWERWIGYTTLEGGRSLVAESDIVILPSHRERWSEAQLPAKLIDAMAVGRAVAVSDIEPLVWAIGDAGKIVRPGNVGDIKRVITDFLDPAVRTDFGARALARARAEFSERALAPRFAEACDAAIDAHAQRSRDSRATR